MPRLSDLFLAFTGRRSRRRRPAPVAVADDSPPADAVELPECSAAYLGRTILVTGAGGTVGAGLCRHLLQMQPARLVMLDVSEFALCMAERDLSATAHARQTEIIAVLGTVTDKQSMAALMTEHAVDIVFHAAAYKHVPMVEANPLAGLANNVLGTKAVADAAIQSGVQKFILISTDKALRPASAMGATKRLAESVVQDLATRSGSTAFSIVRFGNVLGSSGSVVPLFQQQIARGGPLTLTHNDVTRYFMTLDEAVGLLLRAGSMMPGPGMHGCAVFVLDMGRPVRIRDLAVRMIRSAGLTVRAAENPAGDIEIRITGLRPGEKLHEDPLIREGLLTTVYAKILRTEEAGLSEFEMASVLRAAQIAVSASSAPEARALIDHYTSDQPRPASAVL